ncbi:MAG: hypothetical protein K0S86_845 [Geminicoccaceae bacterium]|jgi:hypothetical protein|nr:hypothetical protein [Geminicoccaceae bacterium]
MTSRRLALEPAETTPGERAMLSLLVPGLGQFAQRRFIVGASQLGTVLAYSATALALGGGRAMLIAVAWNVWSAVDAYRHERL